MNVHKRCQKNVANNCGINPKQIAMLLQQIGISDQNAAAAAAAAAAASPTTPPPSTGLGRSGVPPLKPILSTHDLKKNSYSPSGSKSASLSQDDSSLNLASSGSSSSSSAAAVSSTSPLLSDSAVKPQAAASSNAAFAAHSSTQLASQQQHTHHHHHHHHLQQQQKPVHARRRVGLEHFSFVRVLGKGSFGKVLLAEHRATGEHFAIKVYTYIYIYIYILFVDYFLVLLFKRMTFFPHLYPFYLAIYKVVPIKFLFHIENQKIKAVLNIIFKCSEGKKMKENKFN